MSLVRWMQKVFNMVVKSSEASRDWRRAIAIPFYKTTDCLAVVVGG